MAKDTWAEFIRQTAGDASPAEIARQVGMHRSVIGNWLRGGGVEAAAVIGFARAYGANVLAALVAAGYITDKEADLHSVHMGLDYYLSTELLRELIRRVRTDVSDPAQTAGLNEFGLAADTEDHSPDEDLRTP